MASLPFLLAGMAAMLVLTKEGKLVKKKDFDCPICIELDPYRDEPACAQCEKHHDWMQAASSRGKQLTKTVVSTVALREESLVEVSSQAMEIDRLKKERNLIKALYAGWGAALASILWSMLFFI